MSVFTLEELSQHNSKDDLWIAISGKVYDITNFVDEHPGGEVVLFGQAGADATIAFQDVGHSKDAQLLMTNYYIGELDNNR